jgi:cytochrome oxidase Cu insertion factor (SCO1/SenC/PrrC family)/thiol-disulfide isomerase/thioredoxin
VRPVWISLWVVAALVAGATLAYVVAAGRAPSTPGGTLLVLASGAQAGEVAAATPVQIVAGGQAFDAASLQGAVPAAPQYRQLAERRLAAGHYDGVRVGGREVGAPFAVEAGTVVPLLLAVGDGGLLPGGAYAGIDNVNLGLSELGGKLAPMPDFKLVDQAGTPLDRAALLGRPTVIGSFHTTCHETCPLYTALFMQLRQKAGPGVRLLEVTTDPTIDTPGVLAQYARSVGADWTFATGTPPAVAAFWEPFDMTLSTGDTHTDRLLVVDQWGYLRVAYGGAPDVGGTVPPAILAQLDASGLQKLNSHGSGWDAQQVTDTLRGLNAFAARSTAGGGRAPEFEVAAFDGHLIRLSQFAGRAVVLNFYASWCLPCEKELPLLESSARSHAGVQFLLLDWRDDPGQGQALLTAHSIRTPLAGNDFEGRVGSLYGVLGLPMTVFIRSDGRVESTVRGQLDEATLAGHVSAIAG